MKKIILIFLVFVCNCKSVFKVSKISEVEKEKIRKTDSIKNAQMQFYLVDLQEGFEY